MTNIGLDTRTKVSEFDRQFDFKEGEVLKTLTYIGEGGEDSFVRCIASIVVI